jgi:hypothetical protein
MSDSVALEQKKSRRGLLALAGAGGAAAVAALLGRRNGAEAHGDVQGNSSTDDPAVHGNNTGDGPGVEGSATGGPGVEGWSTGNGVYGHSSGASGVYGTSQGPNGVWGNSAHATGVKGTGKPGVYGICNIVGGAGVRGDGTKAGSIGLYGVNTPGRRALRTKGRVQMDTARKVTLSNRSNTVSLPTSVRADSNAIVMAMVQGPPGNEAFVRRAFRVDSTHIRITFNKKPTNPTAVGYWVVHTG